jgi:phosphatidylethanolamine N-methyltransferase
MVSQLFDPTKPKVALDLIVVAALAYLILLFNILPISFRVPIFAVHFLFWRFCYNFGIGWLLHNQSHHKRLVKWAKKSKIFEHPEKGASAYPLLSKFLKRDMETMIKQDYVFEEAPIEYNTWLIFRRVVDLILMSDFISYCLFAIANTHIPENENVFMTIGRFVGGIALVLFNLWVKLDAHRVVKDYAWFWGDFFFLVDQELTFDGVFMMCPHPMYSIGYVGFYGIALMAASYNVLFISIIAHAAQLTFLTFVENPHIDRTYNTPPPKKRLERAPDSPPATASLKNSHRRKSSIAGHVNDYPPLATSTQPSPVHNLIGIRNLDLLRVTDIAVVILQIYMYSIAVLTPTTLLWQTLFVLNAIAWRLWYTVGLGFILDRQAYSKWWTRHFVKYGESTEEAWRQWKGMYHISMVMCYTSFICAAWKMYGLPPDWEYGTALLRHVIGFGLIALQMWTSNSSYESLGEFGWFFGDFFFDHAPKLTYTGIYRYLNNPERTIAMSGVWGFAIITWSKSVFFLALLSHVLTLCFIQFVEKPHMQKLYHAGLRQQSGVTESVSRALPTPIKKWTGSVDKVFDETMDSLEEFIEASGPKLAAGFNTFIKDSTTLFKQFPARVSITRLSPELAGYDPKDYSIAADPTQSAKSQSEFLRDNDLFNSSAKSADGSGRLVVPYGAPIRVKWTAPLNHSKKDWIGLYMVGDNLSREVTSVRSAGRWVATNPDPWENSKAHEGILLVDQRVSGSTRKDGEVTDFLAGEVELSGDKLWWTEGTFELRYHHDGRYNVTAISLPFEIKVARFDESVPAHLDEYAEGLSRPAVEKAILPMLQDCFDRDPDVAPRTVDEHFGSAIARDGKFAQRVVYAVRSMFGIEFAPDVVQADGNVRNLAWRICNAKKVLAPYSMTETNIPTTP